jgi:hypothetical protein
MNRRRTNNLKSVRDGSQHTFALGHQLHAISRNMCFLFKFRLQPLHTYRNSKVEGEAFLPPFHTKRNGIGHLNSGRTVELLGRCL